MPVAKQPPELDEEELELLDDELDDEPELLLVEDVDVPPPLVVLVVEVVELALEAEAPQPGGGQGFAETGSARPPRPAAAGHAWSVPNTT